MASNKPSLHLQIEVKTSQKQQENNNQDHFNNNERVSELSTGILEQQDFELMMENHEKIQSAAETDVVNFLRESPMQNLKFLRESMEAITPNSSTSWSQNKKLFSEKKQLTLNLGSSMIIKGRRKTQFMLKSQQFLHTELEEEEQINFNNLLNKDINEEYYEQKYEELEEIGRGFQAVVNKVKERQTDKIYAAKIFFHKDDEELKDNIRNEYNILKEFDNKYIVKVYELIETQKVFIIIMEYINGVCLQELKYKIFTDAQKISVISKLLKIIKYIHSHNIIHRDLSSKNVLWDESSNQLKLIDFGIAKQFINKEINLTPCGDTAWQAPEIIKGLGYTEKCDIWQVGCISYELLEKIDTNEKIQNVILQMLTIDSSFRISAEEALALLKLQKQQ